MQPIKNNTNTVKHCCGKSKCRVSNVFEEELVIIQLQILNRNMKLSFRVPFHKICRTQNLFLLILLFLRLKCKRSNSQSISFLVEIFGIAFQFTRSFLTKLNFSRSSKIFSNPRKIFSCLRKIIFPVRGKISEVDSSLKTPPNSRHNLFTHSPLQIFH